MTRKSRQHKCWVNCGLKSKCAYIWLDGWLGPQRAHVDSPDHDFWSPNPLNRYPRETLVIPGTPANPPFHLPLQGCSWAWSAQAWPTLGQAWIVNLGSINNWVKLWLSGRKFEAQPSLNIHTCIFVYFRIFHTWAFEWYWIYQLILLILRIILHEHSKGV